MAGMTTSPARAYRGAFVTRRRRSWTAGVGVRGLPLAALGLVLAAALSPQSPPTADAFSSPSLYHSVWSVRLGPANLFEIGAAAVGSMALLKWALAPTRQPARSRFDLAIFGFICVIAGLQAIALFRGLPADRFLAFDLERVIVPVVGYVLVTRAITDSLLLRRFVLVLAGALLARGCELVVVHGLLGSTQFGTAKGGTALLITEDALLIGIPVLIAWGALVDGRLKPFQSLGAVSLVVAALAVDSLSLRRGALLFLAVALVLRSLVLPRRQLILAGSACAIAATVLLLAAPTLSLVENGRYAIESAIGQRSDASTSQRASERRDFGRNVNGLDWLVGRGMGTVWRAQEPGPVQLGSFGSKETAHIRIGWHAYGLDWLYKFGLLGGALLLGAVVAALLTAIRSARRAPDSTRTLVLSLGAMLPFLVLLTLTNLRVGFMAGVLFGLLSRSADFYPTPTPAHSSKACAPPCGGRSAAPPAPVRP